jgi:fructokinase
MSALYGGIEGGGTKFVCVIGTGPDDIRAHETFPTTSPEETLGAAAEFFARHRAALPITALGIGCFGPIDLDPASATWGAITTTPKPGWSGTNVAGHFAARLGVPIGWETDVNAAALAERRWGAARGLDSLVYFTVGTGIGGGALVAGRPLHGLVHPEMGHIPLTPLLGAAGAAGAGVCPYHGGNCLEGVASGPALAARAGRPAEALAADDPLWEDEARYLAFGAATAALLLSPQRIIIGGGVLKQAHLYPRIRAHFTTLVGGYVRSSALADGAALYIVPPLLGDRAGALGALALAEDAAAARTHVPAAP